DRGRAAARGHGAVVGGHGVGAAVVAGAVRNHGAAARHQPGRAGFGGGEGLDHATVGALTERGAGRDLVADHDVVRGLAARGFAAGEAVRDARARDRVRVRAAVDRIVEHDELLVDRDRGGGDIERAVVAVLAVVGAVAGSAATGALAEHGLDGHGVVGGFFHQVRALRGGGAAHGRRRHEVELVLLAVGGADRDVADDVYDLAVAGDQLVDVGQGIARGVAGG